MPRGRAGLLLIPPDQVREAIRYMDTERVAVRFGVASRTVRRWLKTGLPLNYGRTGISLDSWNGFAKERRDARRRYG